MKSPKLGTQKIVTKLSPQKIVPKLCYFYPMQDLERQKHACGILQHKLDELKEGIRQRDELIEVCINWETAQYILLLSAENNILSNCFLIMAFTSLINSTQMIVKYF